MNNNSSSNNPIRGNFNFANPGGFQMQMPTPANFGPQQSPNLQSQSQSQPRPYFPGNFQTTDPQAQTFVQPQTVQTQPQRPPIMSQNPVNSNTSILSPVASTPNSGTAKRLHKPPSRASGGSSSQGMGSPMKTMELAPAVRRAKRKLPDKVIPEKIAAILPESALYTQLLEYESRVDAFLARKKTDIEEQLKNPLQSQKILRIYVFNTFTNQTGVDDDKKNAEPPSWCLRLVGRVLEGGKDPVLDGLSEQPSVSYPKFSFFIKKISIYLDQSLYPENHVIVWEGSRSPAQREGFEVKRKGDKEFTAIIRLEMNYGPEKFKLSPALQEILGIEIETRSRVLAAIWQYVKARKLQIPGDSSSFMCDPPLRKVFSEENVKFSMVTQRLQSHLSPPGPIHLEHRVKLSGNNPAGNTCYEIPVDVPLPLEKEMTAFLGDLEKNKEIEAYEETISSAVKKIHEHCRRRAFFLGFSQSPAEFTNALIASQARDLKLTASESTRDPEKERKAEFYNQPWIEDAVIRYLNRKPAAGNELSGNK